MSPMYCGVVVCINADVDGYNISQKIGFNGPIKLITGPLMSIGEVHRDRSSLICIHTHPFVVHDEQVK